MNATPVVASVFIRFLVYSCDKSEFTVNYSNHMILFFGFHSTLWILIVVRRNTAICRSRFNTNLIVVSPNHTSRRTHIVYLSREILQRNEETTNKRFVSSEQEHYVVVSFVYTNRCHQFASHFIESKSRKGNWRRTWNTLAMKELEKDTKRPLGSSFSLTLSVGL